MLADQISTQILRPYQLDALASVRREWARLRATLVVAATGTGKTIMFLSLLDQLRREEQLTRALVLVHKIDLTTQPLEKASRFFSELSWGMGVVQAARNDVAARVIVSTVQSLTPKRLELIRSNGPISHVIVDEAHHAVARTFADVIAQFPEAKVVGFTATPIRADERGLRGVFESVAYRLPIRQAIAEGALVKPVVLGFGLPGANPDQMQTIFEADNYLEMVLAKWREHAAGRRTVAFTSTIAQAHTTAAYFTAHGVSAAAISGETPRRERERVRAALVAGDVSVVANAQVWTEGTDIPEIAAMLILRNYRPHDGPFIQMVGRGLRPAPGKTDCVILDFNPAQGRNFNLEGDLLGDAIELDAAEADAQPDELTEEDALEALQQLSFGWHVDPAKLTTLVMDYLKFDALAWVSHAPCHWMSNLNRDEALWIIGPDGERVEKAKALQGGPAWTAAMERAYQHLLRWRLYVAANGYDSAEVVSLGVFADFEQAKASGDAYALDHLERVLADRSARWRNDPATEPQLRVLRGLGRRSHDALTKGEAAALISWKKGFKHVEAYDRYEAKLYQFAPALEAVNA